MKQVTVLFLRREGEILLALKKRGFGVGKWNGVGGKVDENETIEQAATRECREEIGVTPRDIQKVGELDFFMTDDPDFHHNAHIFMTETWEGEPIETEEMNPQWFALAAIPYENMWADDIDWLPLLLEGKKFKGTYHLDKNDQVHTRKLEQVANL